MFDFARASTRRSAAPFSPFTFAATITTRATAPKATEPVTRSVGSRPSVPLLKCEIPSAAAFRLDDGFDSAEIEGRSA